MRTIKFRPLRRIKKTGKITMASYMQWRSVTIADIDEEYKSFPKDELVYNHKGEHLYFYKYNPEHIPIMKFNPVSNIESMGLAIAISSYFDNTPARAIDWGDQISYAAPGIDCDGVPAFAHYTENRCKDMDNVEPLTVEMVTEWLDWILSKRVNLLCE